MNANSPKVELHIHIDGAIRFETIHEIMTSKGAALPGNGSIEDLRKAVVLNKATDLNDFLSRFNIFLPSFRGNLQAAERIMYELCEDLSKNGVIYFEGRLAPHLTASIAGEEPVVTAEMILQSYLAGLKRGQQDFKIKGRIILAYMRGISGWGNELVDFCQKYKNEGVVGIDLAGNELNGLLESYDEVNDKSFIQEEIVQAFKKARDLGIHRTVHTCEIGPAKVVDVSVNELHAERFGHGYRVLQSDEIYKKVQDLNIHLECCPLSSIVTGCMRHFTTHPLLRFANDKMNFSISSDDPTITGAYINSDFEFCRELGLTEDDLITATLNAAKSCFLPEEEKQDLINSLSQYYFPSN